MRAERHWQIRPQQHAPDHPGLTAMQEGDVRGCVGHNRPQLPVFALDALIGLSHGVPPLHRDASVATPLSQPSVGRTGQNDFPTMLAQPGRPIENTLCNASDGGLSGKKDFRHPSILSDATNTARPERRTGAVV